MVHSMLRNRLGRRWQSDISEQLELSSAEGLLGSGSELALYVGHGATRVGIAAMQDTTPGASNGRRSNGCPRVRTTECIFPLMFVFNFGE